MNALLWMTPFLCGYALYQKMDGFASVWAGVLGFGLKFYFDKGQHTDTAIAVTPTTTETIH